MKAAALFGRAIALMGFVPQLVRRGALSSPRELGKGYGSYSKFDRPHQQLPCEILPREASAAKRLRCVPGMFDSLEVKVLCTVRWRRSAREAQGRRREAGSGGSVEQNRDLTNRNRIRGILGRTSGQRIAKSRAIKGQGCRSGRCAAKAVRLTPGGLRSVLSCGTEEAVRRPNRNAEVSRRQSRPCSR